MARGLPQNFTEQAGSLDYMKTAKPLRFRDSHYRISPALAYLCVANGILVPVTLYICVLV